MAEFRRELRLAVRALLRSPTFSVASILTLMLGIAAVTAVFSVVYAVLLAPLPYPGGERLVRVYSTNLRGGVTRGPVSPPDFWDFREQARTLEAITLMYPYEGTVEDPEGNPVRIQAYVVSPDFFNVLRVRMAAGRAFIPEDNTPNGPVSVVLSHALWQSVFNSDPSVVGRTVILEGSPANVIGVAEPGFAYPRGTILWLHPPMQYATMARRGRSWDVIALLRPGVAPDAAERDLATIARRLETEHPQWNSGFGVAVQPLKQAIVGDLRTPLAILMAAASLLLLVSCANVANLLLARGATRMRESALRSALGASRWRLMRGVLLESGVLAMVGAIAGIGLALLALFVFRRMAPPSASMIGDATVNGTSLLFALAVTIGATLLVGLTPALRASMVGIRAVLSEGGRSGGFGVRGGMLRRALVVVEIALATVVVIGAGLLGRSLRNVTRVDPGFSAPSAMTFDLMPPIAVARTPDNIRDFYANYTRELAALPGVRRAGYATSLPFGPQFDPLRPYRLLDRPEPEPGSEPMAWMRSVSVGFFDAMEMRIVEGRPFSDLDHVTAPPVAIVNEEFVRRQYPETSPLNQHIHLYSVDFMPLGRILNREVEIVGVVNDVRYAGPTSVPEPAIYFPSAQAPFRRNTIVLEGQGDPASLIGPARERLKAVAPGVAISRAMRMTEVVRAATLPQRFATTLLFVFGGVSLVLAVIGVYGVISYQVTERSTELAVRMAIGAEPGRILELVLSQGARVAAAGIVLGIGGALAFARLLASQLYGVGSTDPVTVLSVIAVLGIVSLIATAIPAWRATRIDPAITLKPK